MITFGGGSSSGKSSSNPVQLQMYNPQQQAMMNALYGQVAGGLGGPVASYPGMMYVPQLPQEQPIMDIGQTQANYVQGGYQNALNEVLAGKPAYDINPQISQDYFSKAIEPLMLRQFKNTTLPQVTESFAGPGYWGNARAQAEANAASNLATDIGAAEAGVAYSDEQARRAALEAAANRQAQVALPALQTGVAAVGTAGNYARMIEEEATLANLQRWFMGETVNGVTPTQYNPYLQLAFQFMGLTPYAYGTQSQSRQSGFNFGLGISSSNSGGR